MSQARQRRHFARGAERVRSARRGEEIFLFIFSPPLVSSHEMPHLPRLGHKAPVMQANESISQKVVYIRR